MDKKRCSKCGEVKPLSEFCNHKSGKDGKSSICKTCKSAADKEYRLRNSETIKRKEKVKRIRDKEKISACQKKCYQKNKEYYKNKSKEWRINNKEYYDIMMTRSREKYKPKKIIKDREYREKHKNEIREYKRKWFHEKYNSDIEFNILFKLRRRVWMAIKTSETKKNEPIKKLIGCSILDLKQYIESKFKPGMSWDNYGKFGWHIDHIIPCASFDLTDPEQQRRCFNYKNLQPLWAKENHKKGARIA